MRFKSARALASLALAAAASLSFDARARGRGQQPQEPQQQQDEKVIDDFVTTRGVSFEAPKGAKPKAGSQAQRKNNAPASKSSGGAAASRKGAASVAKKGSAKAGAQTSPAETAAQGDGGDGATAEGPDADGAKIIKASAPDRMALGYTLYLKDATGALFPVEPSRSYKSGDRIALVLETNTDGYLYVFNAENGRNALMLYPHVQLDGGANAVSAHVRETYPADLDLAFEFDERPATEHLYVVVSREPLAGVPAGAALAKYCAKAGDECYWRPGAELWARIAAAASDRRVVEAKSAQVAQAGARPVAPGTLSRGIKIKKDEPKPSVVRVSDSPASKMLVTKIELVHK